MRGKTIFRSFPSLLILRSKRIDKFAYRSIEYHSSCYAMLTGYDTLNTRVHTDLTWTETIMLIPFGVNLFQVRYGDNGTIASSSHIYVIVLAFIEVLSQGIFLIPQDRTPSASDSSFGTTVLNNKFRNIFQKPITSVSRNVSIRERHNVGFTVITIEHNLGLSSNSKYVLIKVYSTIGQIASSYHP